MIGVRSLIRSKSSIVSVDADLLWRRASRWSTLLVEPPVPATAAIAFSKASRVRMSRGRTTAPQQVHHERPAS